MITYTAMLFDRFIYTLKVLFGLDEEFSDELLVAGEGEVSIKLHTKFAGDCSVYFVDDAEACVPCNPGADDTVTCSVVNSGHKRSVLKVQWKVSGTRTVQWYVSY